MERPPELIGGERIEASVLRDGRRAGHRVEQPLHARPDLLLGRAAATASARLGGTGEVVEVDPLCLVELQRPCERVEHGLGDTREVAALEPRVVVDAHAGEERDLLPAEPRNPPVLPIPGKARLLRRDPRAPGGQELAGLASRVHGTRVRPFAWRWEALPVPGTTGSVTRRTPVLPWLPERRHLCEQLSCMRLGTSGSRTCPTHGSRSRPTRSSASSAPASAAATCGPTDPWSAARLGGRWATRRSASSRMSAPRSATSSRATSS